jgi:hypothetical protein
VSEIGVEIEESAEISDRISETKQKINKQTKAAKNHDNINATINDANSNLNSATCRTGKYNECNRKLNKHNEYDGGKRKRRKYDS